MRSIFLIFLIAIASSCATAQRPLVPESILGDWYGESKCVGSNTFCHDEVVVYHLTLVKNDPSKVHWAADKIVNGKVDPMGELDFTYDDKASTISGEFPIPRTGGKGVWAFKIEGEKMHGTLTTYPEAEVGRKVEVSRKKPANFPI